MASINRILLIGHIGQQPTVQYTQSGLPICKLSVATDESYTNKFGETIKQTEWHKVNTYNRLAEVCSKSLGKGSLVYVEGRITTRKWSDNEGRDRYSTEINALKVIFIDRKQAIRQEKLSYTNYIDNYNKSSANLCYGTSSVMDDTPFDTVPF